MSTESLSKLALKIENLLFLAYGIDRPKDESGRLVYDEMVEIARQLRAGVKDESI